MNVLVLGAGVAGLCAAYALAKDGNRVTIVESRDDVALGASFANGAQLSYSYVSPFANPDTLAKLPGLLTDAESPSRFYPGAHPRQWAWALRFLVACTRSRSELTVRHLLALSALSRRLMHRAIAEERMEFDFSQRGKLVVHSDQASWRRARAALAYQQSFGCEQHALDLESCLALEPSLFKLRDRLVGGVFAPGDEAGDCQAFCRGLSSVLTSTKYGARLVLGTTLLSLRRRDRRITAAITDRGELEADAYVLALGLASRSHARTLGFDLPLWGVKGYSLTFQATETTSPRISVTDLKHGVVYAPLGRHIRVAGFADVDWDETCLRPERLDGLKQRALATFPDGLDPRDVSTWVGARPATPTGMPILGLSPGIDNLFLNVGHGALGFTLAMASGRIVADRVANRPLAAELGEFVT